MLSTILKALTSLRVGSASDAGRGATRERNREVGPLPKIKDNVKDVMFFI